MARHNQSASQINFHQPMELSSEQKNVLYKIPNDFSLLKSQPEADAAALPRQQQSTERIKMTQLRRRYQNSVQGISKSKSLASFPMQRVDN